MAVTLFAEKEKTANSALGYAHDRQVLPPAPRSLPMVARENEGKDAVITCFILDLAELFPIFAGIILLDFLRFFL